MLAGFVAGGATPNVAGGGMTDVFRAGMAGMGTVSRMQQEGRARQYQDARLATEQMNNENQQDRLMMQTQSQNSLREAQAEQYRAKARQIREMHNSGMLVIDRKGALQRQPDGTWKPVDFDTQNVIEAMAKFRAQLKKDGRTDEEINTLMDSKFYGYKKPAPAAPNASIVNAEKKEEKEKTLNERVGFYLRNSDNDPKKALNMAKADSQLPNDAFTQVEAELRKRIPKPPPAPKPNISAARYSDTKQDQMRANKYLAENSGDAKAAFEAATRAGDNAAATLIRPNIRKEKKKSLFGSGPAATPKLPPAAGSGKGRVVVDQVTGKRTYVR
jgi:hypothetical protein